MFILARSPIDRPYMYLNSSARKVSKTSARQICDIVNSKAWTCKPNEIWRIFEICDLDPAFGIAQRQSFTIRKGIVTARCY